MEHPQDNTNLIAAKVKDGLSYQPQRPTPENTEVLMNITVGRKIDSNEFFYATQKKGEAVRLSCLFPKYGDAIGSLRKLLRL